MPKIACRLRSNPQLFSGACRAIDCIRFSTESIEIIVWMCVRVRLLYSACLSYYVCTWIRVWVGSLVAADGLPRPGCKQWRTSVGCLESWSLPTSLSISFPNLYSIFLHTLILTLICSISLSSFLAPSPLSFSFFFFFWISRFYTDVKQFLSNGIKTYNTHAQNYPHVRTSQHTYLWIDMSI